MEPGEQYALIAKTELRSLNDAIRRYADQLTALNNRAKEIEEVFSCQFEHIAKDHEKQLNLRIEQMNQQYAKMQDIADKHSELFSQECKSRNEEQNRLDDTVNRLAKCDAKKKDLAERLVDAYNKLDESNAEKNKLSERLDDAENRLAESVAEKKDLAERLYVSNNKLDEIDASNNRLRSDLDNCKLELVALNKDSSLLQNWYDEANNKLAETDAKNRRLYTELKNCRLELQTNRELASITKLRQLKELDVTEEISAMMSRFKKQDIVCSNAADAEETGDLNKQDDVDPSLPDYIQRIQRIYEPLLEKLEPKKVAAFMFTNDALTVKELQSVQHSHKTHYEASEELLRVIKEVKEQHIYDCFLKALRDTNQHHIWSWVSYDDYDIDCEHVRLIQKHYSFVVAKMDSRDSGLLAELYTRGVIDERDKGDIEAETSSIPRNEKLLSYLGRKSREKFILFLDALIKTGHELIVSRLRGQEEVHNDNSDNGTVASEHGHSVNTECSDNIVDTTTAVPETLTPSTASSRSIGANKSSTAVDTHAVAVRAESKSPTLKHVIPSDGRREVVGLTFINNELFVLRDPSEEEIQVYETATFTQQRTVRVARLRDGWLWSKALTSCDVNNCLFVCDICNVYKVDLSTNNVINWQVGCTPTGLSVNDARHVIVTCYHGNEIREYEQTGQLIHTIKLKKSHVTEPLHAVQLNESMFVVSHYGPVDGVSLIDTQGRVTATYRNSESTELLNKPRQLTVGKNGSVLVVDCDNNRLVVLDASFKNAHELTLPIDGGLNGPRCLYFNDSLGRLYVGESNGQRVVICDNISVD